jgi:hypothetical protein
MWEKELCERIELKSIILQEEFKLRQIQRRNNSKIYIEK